MMDLPTTSLLSAVGYALVAFVWQGAAIGLATAVALIVARRGQPAVRYVIGCVGLMLMALAPVVTAVRALPQTAGQPTASIAGDVITTQQGIEEDSSVPHTSAPWTVRGRIDPYLPGISVLWAAGVLTGGLHLLAGWFRLRRLLRSACPLESGCWPATLRTMADQLGVTSRVRILTSALAEVPAVVGWLRPAIIVPSSALAGLPAAYLDAVLAHELAHLRRRDYLVNALQCALEVLLFYHPAVWWVSKQVRLERELCCDDAAVSTCGDRDVYVRALVSLEELRSHCPRLVVGATHSGLLGRIRRLIEPSVTESPTWSGGIIMAFTLPLLLIVGGLHAGAAEQKQPAASMHEQSVPKPAEVQAITAPSPILRTATISAQQQHDLKASLDALTKLASDQLPTGGIDGRVIDPAGGVVPGVTVVVASTNKELARTIVSNARGEFLFSQLPVGTYDVSLSLAGFRTATGTIAVVAGKVAPVRFRLEVGRLEEVVTVAGAAPVNASGPRTDTAVQIASQLVDLRRELEVLKARGYSDQHADVQRLASAIAFLEQQSKSVGAGPQTPIRVGGDIREPAKLKDVKPVYPADALAAGIQGTVTIEAVLARDGTVQRARVLQGVPELDDAALTAVTQWLYRPTLLNGQPVEIVMTVKIVFVARLPADRRWPAVAVRGERSLTCRSS